MSEDEYGVCPSCGEEIIVTKKCKHCYSSIDGSVVKYATRNDMNSKLFYKDSRENTSRNDWMPYIVVSVFIIFVGLIAAWVFMIASYESIEREGIFQSVLPREERRDMIQDLPPSSKLEIQPDYSFESLIVHTFLTGRVKNISNNEINYFEVIVEFVDESGQVLDSYYTKDDLKLSPGEMRGFEIQFKFSEDFKKYRIFIGDVR